jgi:anaerobic selenocysteine-containing dehydrogenase
LAFYNTGQILLEEYYTLAVIAKAGLGTPHVDGNTRLCTATAAVALMESFGTDGQPGCYRDIDLTDALFLVGHNMAEQQTVLWMRILDRVSGPKRPKIIVVDPRRTATAKLADLHLAPRPSTNVALLNGLLKLLIDNNHVDREFIEKNTVGFDQLVATTKTYTLSRVSEITGIPERSIQEAAEILGSAPTLVSTCLQGV